MWPRQMWHGNAFACSCVLWTHRSEVVQPPTLFQVLVTGPGAGPFHGLLLLKGGADHPIDPARAERAAYGAP